mgnify:CR=1 FL=1
MIAGESIAGIAGKAGMAGVHGGVVEYGTMTQSFTGLVRGGWGMMEEEGGGGIRQDQKHVKRKGKNMPSWCSTEKQIRNKQDKELALKTTYLHICEPRCFFFSDRRRLLLLPVTGRDGRASVEKLWLDEAATDTDEPALPRPKSCSTGGAAAAGPQEC